MSTTLVAEAIIRAIDQFSGPVTKMGAALDTFGRQVGTTLMGRGQKVLQWGQRVGAEMESIGLRTTLLATMFGKAVAQYASYEEAVNDVKGAFPGTTEEFDGLIKKLEELSTTLPVPIEGLFGISKGLLDAGAGKSVDEIVEMTRLAAEMGLVFDQSTDKVKEGIGDMLGRLMAAETAPAKTKRAFEELGLSAKEVSAAFQTDWVTALEALIGEVDKLPQGRKAFVIADLLGIKDPLDVNPVLENLDTIKLRLQALRDPSMGKAVFAELPDKLRTVSSELQAAENSLVQFTKTFVEEVLPTIRTGIETFTSLLDTLRQTPGVVRGLAALGFVAIALGPALLGIGMFIKSLTGIIVLFGEAVALVAGGALAAFLARLSGVALAAYAAVLAMRELHQASGGDWTFDIDPEKDKWWHLPTQEKKFWNWIVGEPSDEAKAATAKAKEEVGQSLLDSIIDEMNAANAQPGVFDQAKLDEMRNRLIRDQAAKYAEAEARDPGSGMGLLTKDLTDVRPHKSDIEQIQQAMKEAKAQGQDGLDALKKKLDELGTTIEDDDEDAMAVLSKAQEALDAALAKVPDANTVSTVPQRDYIIPRDTLALVDGVNAQIRSTWDDLATVIGEKEGARLRHASPEEIASFDIRMKELQAKLVDLADLLGDRFPGYKDAIHAPGGMPWSRANFLTDDFNDFLKAGGDPRRYRPESDNDLPLETLDLTRPLTVQGTVEGEIKGKVDVELDIKVEGGGSVTRKQVRGGEVTGSVAGPLDTGVSMPDTGATP